jgi:Ni/Co efflux regulator RcnB
MAFEQTRDLRSGAHETKRVKDHAHKWARGKRLSPGVKSQWLDTETALTGSEEQQEKFRPDTLPK